MPLKEILTPYSFPDRKGWPMSREPPSEEGRHSLLAKVERLRDEYLEVRNECEHVLQLALEGNQHSEAVNTLNAVLDALNAHKLSLDRYVAAWTKAVGEN